MLLKRRQIILSVIGITLILSVAALAVLFVKEQSSSNAPAAKHAVTKNPPSSKKYKARRYEHGAVASDSEICSNVGVRILQQNGNAIDAAIASIFCTGVINIHSCGIGGGTFLHFYERQRKRFFIYDFREAAPLSSHEKMFVNNTDQQRFGGLAVAVPSQVKGLRHVYRFHGQLTWSELLEPAIKLAEEGFTVTKPVAGAIEYVKNLPQLSAGLRKLLTKADGTFLKEGDILKNPVLAKTLRIIQKDPDSFYKGDLAKQIIKDIQSASGSMVLQDLESYEVKKRDVLHLKLPAGMTLNTIGAPGSGAILAMVINIMSGYDLSTMDLSRDDHQLEFYQKVIESFKFSYARRGLLGDPDYVPKQNITSVYDVALNLSVGKIIREKKIKLNATYEPSYYGGAWGEDDFGTSHLSILTNNGDAVASTSTINYVFGSLVRSEETGIIYNNEMDDFSTPGVPNLYDYPPSVANFIRPGKRPLSSMSPTIVTDENGDVKMVAGASGGSVIISGTSQVLLKSLFIKEELGEAVASFRLHHQGIPNKIEYNSYFPPPNTLLKQLRRIGHNITKRSGDEYSGGGSVVQAIYKDGGYIYAMSDPRKHSKADGY